MNQKKNNNMLGIKDIERLENTSFASAFASTAEADGGAFEANAASGNLSACISDGSCESQSVVCIANSDGSCVSQAGMCNSFDCSDSICISLALNCGVTGAGACGVVITVVTNTLTATATITATATATSHLTETATQSITSCDIIDLGRQDDYALLDKARFS